jgi:hypothetical protein
MGKVIDLRNNSPTAGSAGSLRRLVDELESIVMLQKRALDVLAWRAPGTRNEIATISNTMTTLQNHISVLRATLTRNGHN